jgi:2-amino-4-hydroxy-6-hydroxymethyldihydropteridine diphosphokinase
MRPLAYVGIGANLGDARATVRAACRRLQPLGARRCSSLYRSAPVDAGGPDFINAVAELQPAFAPTALLDALLAIEADFGRERPFRNAPRTLDLDLLLYGDEVMHSPSLTLPHPRLHQRAFVLQPLLELVPALQAPGLGPLAAYLGATADQAIERLAD